MEWRGTPFTILSSISVFFITASVLLYSSTAPLSPVIASTRPEEAFRAPRANVWAELTEAEAADVYQVALKEFAHLNLTTRPQSSLQNSVYMVETLTPNKSEAVPYLFANGEIPERWAKLILMQFMDDGPYLVYYAVGPLPVTDGTRVVPLTYRFNSGRNHVRSPLYDFYALLAFGQNLGKNISDITAELLNATTDGKDFESLVCFPRFANNNSGRFTLWFQFFREGLDSGSRTLLPQGVYVKVDATELGEENWDIGPFYYNGQFYNTANDFRGALRKDEVARTPTNLDGPWTDTEDFEAHPNGRELPPPVTVQPYGPRYKLDREQKFVSWFGFEFYISTAPATGVSLFDIRFKGDRVIYELGLQEAMSHYAGDDPMAGGQEFLDAFFGIGKNMYELVPGYDCPAYADYLDSHYHMQQEKHDLFSNVCVFEFTADHLLSRHAAQYSVTASRNTFLTVRSVSTVGNYDYTIDYIFYLDGTIEVKVRASGFIFAAFYPINRNESSPQYGHRIHDAVASSMHDHVINFKADLDIAGADNDMTRLVFEPLTTSYSWDQPEVPVRNTMNLVSRPITHETFLDWPSNSREAYVVHSHTGTNAWGERRGYRIAPGTGMGTPPHLTILNSTALGSSARWAEHDLWLLRRKDSEPASADPLNYLSPHDPLVDFSRMADGEPLRTEEEDGGGDGDGDGDGDGSGDLVLYFNLGAHHLPHSGDVPNTLMHTSASSVMFVPHNFHDQDPSRGSVQGVRLQLKGKDWSGGFHGEPEEDATKGWAGDLRSRMAGKGERREHETKAKYFGAMYEQSLQIPLDALEPDMRGYRAAEHEVTDLSFNRSAAGAWVIG